MRSKFVYLFLTDLCRMYFKHNYRSYSDTEPGYGASMLKAYILAFSMPRDGKLSEELIRSIHKIAMSFDPNIEGGVYKNEHNNFAIAPYRQIDPKQRVIIPTYSVTADGINEFVKSWLLNNNSPMHCVCLEKRVNPEQSINYVVEGHPEGLKITTISPLNQSSTSQICNFADGIELIAKLLSDPNYKCEVNFFVHEPANNVQRKTTEALRSTVSSFNKEIVACKTDDQKIALIAKYIQKIDHIHPFLDGNIRTCYILLNKLLRDYGLSPTLLMNPNRMDCCSVIEFVQMIKQGQIHFQQLLNHKEGTLELNSPDEISELKKLVFSEDELHDVDQSLVAAFIDCITKDTLAKTNNSGNNPYHFLKAEPVKSGYLDEINALINSRSKDNLSLISSMNDGKYNLVLRKACAHSCVEVIRALLKYKAELSLDITEKSSNGKSAIDWLAENTKLSPSEKETVRADLEQIIKQKQSVPNNN